MTSNNLFQTCFPVQWSLLEPPRSTRSGPRGLVHEVWSTRSGPRGVVYEVRSTRSGLRGLVYEVYVSLRGTLALQANRQNRFLVPEGSLSYGLCFF